MTPTPIPPRPRGFTLVELLIVIVLIAVLLALALPRQVALTTPARAAKAQTAFGALRSAAMLTKSQCLVSGGPCQGAAGNMMLEGALIPMAYAYPAAAGIQAAANLSPHDYEVSGSDPVVFRVPGAPGACQVSYASATAPNTTPAITLDISGC